nr:unnamed protein product [Callosobruchus chinensis]
MSSSSSSELDEDENTELIYIVNFLKEHPVIINKSEVPSIKAQKNNALETLKDELESKYEKVVAVKNILKKINNLEAAIKKKTDTNRTGYKKIKLSPAEQLVFAVMNGPNSNNPVLNKTPSHIEPGPSSPTEVVMPRPPTSTPKRPKEKRESATSI